MPDLEEFKRLCDEKHLSDRGRITRVEVALDKIFIILDTYKDRPRWIVVAIITFLATAVGVLSTELLHNISKHVP